jgi:hypothetical protein
MINMGYCRFENTYLALKECQDALEEEGGESAQSVTEAYYLELMVGLCARIAKDFRHLCNEEEEGD